jgi:nucleobase:cation symporter-1, NCS1 family
MATVCVNVPANLVSPAYDFSNLAPRKVTFWTGALITAALATVIMPWRLLATAGTYVYGWLGTSSDLLGPVAGILIAEYWLVRRTELDVEDLYRANGPYWYIHGFNPIAVISLFVGIGAALIGRVLPAFQLLSDFGWVTGFFVGAGIYAMLSASRQMSRSGKVGS